MHAEILTYSRSRGLFAGVSLDGSTLRPDNSASEKVYGEESVSEGHRPGAQSRRACGRQAHDQRASEGITQILLIRGRCRKLPGKRRDNLDAKLFAFFHLTDDSCTFARAVRFILFCDGSSVLQPGSGRQLCPLACARSWSGSFLSFHLGPGFITANVDNDAGGIYTYASAGSQFGYSLLWTIIPIAIVLTMAQEISARMGVVTGKGLSELIHEEYGLRITFLLMCGTLVL